MRAVIRQHTDQWGHFSVTQTPEAAGSQTGTRSCAIYSQGTRASSCRHVRFSLLLRLHALKPPGPPGRSTRPSLLPAASSPRPLKCCPVQWLPRWRTTALLSSHPRSRAFPHRVADQEKGLRTGTLHPVSRWSCPAPAAKRNQLRRVMGLRCNWTSPSDQSHFAPSACTGLTPTYQMSCALILSEPLSQRIKPMT